MSIIHDKFAELYIDQFMEVLVLGCSGGLYGEVITECNGIFDEATIRKFIRFQHGDNDYISKFGTVCDNELTDDIKSTTKALLDLVDSDWYCKSHYVKVSPRLIYNATKSFNLIIDTCDDED